MKISGVILFLSVLFGSLQLQGATGAVANTPRDPAPHVTPRGELIIFPFTADYLAVAGHYSKFFDEQVSVVYKTRLSLAERLVQQQKLKSWSYRFFINFAAADVMAEYLPVLRDAFQNPAHFVLSVNGREASRVKHGYWVNAAGCQRLSRLTQPGTEAIGSPDLVFFAYMKLAEPLKNGDVLTVASGFGESAELAYDDLKTISRSIKVNQEGYAPYAGRKYAYFGQWLGAELGPLEAAELEGREFHIRSADDNRIAFTGKIEPRMPEQFVSYGEMKMPLNGEVVMQMDFSNFSLPGRYFIHIPGVGRSWEFIVGENALGRAFYVQMRGLFHQRSGIAKEPQYTQWSMATDHPHSYQGGFMPNDRHYSGKSGQIKNAKGETTDVRRHFEVVRATATDKKLPDVYGGWWDAGDFDRRPYHFEVVDALLSVYLLFPENFSDNQLDLPESGNGIPDIVDEAAWGVDVWRRAQNAAGGVGCWLEATSHPLDPDPTTDTQPYYLALPTRESTVQYCAYAAKLARVYRKCGRDDLAELFYASAARAWNYAMDPANTVSTTFTIKGEKLFYREPEQLPEERVFKAAINLYLYNRDAELLKYIDSLNSKAVLQFVQERNAAYFLSELVEEPETFFLLSRAYERMILKKANFFRKAQEELAYRNVNWPPGHPYFLYLAWGDALPLRKGSTLIMAWRISRNPVYRDSALLCFDWMMGTNPMGRTMTTGLGKVYPVRLLSLPMYAWRDKWADPIPGLTLYTFSETNNYSVTDKLFGYFKEARPDHKYKGCNITLLPDFLSRGKTPSRQECFQIVQQAIPVWRRFASLEGEAVNQNEFTVAETMAPAAAAYGALLQPGWRPPPEWKNLKPQSDIRKLNGYIFLP